MRHQLLHVLLALAFVSGGNPADGQNLPGNKKARTPADYQLRTLKELVALETAAESRHDEEDGVILRGDVRPSRVRVTYKGATRPLPRSRKDVLEKWARRFAGNPEHYTVPYETELLFIEDETKHWLAVNEKLIPQLEKELKAGAAVDLYLVRLGAVRTAGEWEWLMLVESFQKH